jgi:ABC-type Fe3+ transport system permease subunit
MDWQSIQQLFSSRDAVLAATAVSIAVLVLCTVGVVIVLVRLPQDYFLQRRGPLIDRLRRNSWWKNLLLVGKNLLGVVLVLAGVLMLVLPGQGIITVLAGLVLLDYPRKHEVERKIVSRKPVRRAINWLRERFSTPPLRV